MSGVDRVRDALRLSGTSHTLRAMPVDGSIWCAMIDIESPTHSALLTPEHAVVLRDWLTKQIDALPFPCKCGHADVLHDDEGECFVAECKCEGNEP